MIDRKGKALRIGEHVRWYLGEPGGGGYACLIGVMASGGLDDEIVCLATEQAIGMPINTAHITGTGDVHPHALAYRERYLAQFPGAFKSTS